MKAGWEIKKLGEVCDVFAGQGAPQGESNYGIEGVPFIKAGNLEDLINGLPESMIQHVSDEVAKKHKLKLYESNSIVFAKSGMSCMKGHIYTLKGDCYVVSHLAILTPRKIVSSFLNYVLRFHRPNSLIKDSAYPSISLEDIKSFSIPVPPLPEQERIVSELDLISGVIEKKKQQLKELDSLAQSIFYEMFGNPVENEKGWEVKKLGEEFEISSGGTPDTKNALYWDNGNISWIGSNMCQNEIIYENDGKYITEEGLSHSSAKRYASGYVLVALVGATIGKTALLKFPTTTNQNVAGINVISNTNYTSEYIFYLIQNLYGLFMSIGNGKFKMANLSFVRSLPLLTPPLFLQQEFASMIKSIERQKELIKQSLKDTETLFDSRMDFYFN